MAATMESNGTRTQEIRELKRLLTLKQKILGIFQKILGFQTRLEKLQWEVVARKVARKHNISEDIFVAVLYCESGMNPKAVNRNKNGTTDYGICQFNDYWYRTVISPDVALNQPEVALNLMATAWRNGKQNDWICYRNKKYISWLKP